MIEQQNQEGPGTSKHSPVDTFMYALKSSEARRQYPKRLKILFDFLGILGSFEAHTTEFLAKARQNAQSCQDTIITSALLNLVS